MEDLKTLSYKCIFDKRSKMSGRISGAILYVVIRAGEIIDWWFPVRESVPLTGGHTVSRTC